MTRPRLCFRLALLASALFVTPETVAVEPPGDEYVFVPDTNRTVALYRSTTILKGKLDKAGDFVCEKVISFDRVEAVPGRFEFVARDRGWKSEPLPIPLNFPDMGSPDTAVRDWPVYEYRSGTLIKGTLLRDRHRFLPDEGATVITFKEYKYGPDTPLIWNLPGRFEKKPPK